VKLLLILALVVIGFLFYRQSEKVRTLQQEAISASERAAKLQEEVDALKARSVSARPGNPVQNPLATPVPTQPDRSWMWEKKKLDPPAHSPGR
jgi:hypothetical protein